MKSKDVQLAVDCLGDLQSAMNEILPQVDVSKTDVSLAVWLKVGGGVEAVKEALHKHSTFTIDATETRRLSIALAGGIKDLKERWSAQFNLEPSINKEIDHLFVKLNTLYWADGSYRTLEEHKKHVDELLTAILARAGFGLEATTKCDA